MNVGYHKGMIHFKDPVISFLNVFHEHNHEAFVVGGCVRDALIGKESIDIDVTTSASIDDIQYLFEANIISKDGIEYQSLTIEYHNQLFQVTSYRHDSEYEHHRFPKTRRVISFQDDVWRRDFTMNGLYWNEQKGLVDLVGGIEDIHHKLIRTIQDPSLRFQEDALRLLRAFRFSAQLGFDIERNTYNACLQHKELILSLSKERVTQEVMKALNGDYIQEKYTELRSYLLDVFKLEGYYAQFDLSLVTHPLVRWLLMFKPKKHSLFDAMNHFSFTNKQKELLIMMDEHAYLTLQDDKIMIKTLLKRISMDTFGALCQLHYALGNLNQERFNAIINTVQDIHLNEEAYTLAHLKIKGDVCVKKKMSYTQIASFLQSCLDLVIAHPELNTPDYLSMKCDEWIIEHQ